MTLITIITIAILAIVSTAVIWALGNLGSWLGLKRDNEIMKMAETWVQKAIESFEEDIKEYLEKGASAISEKNDIVDKIMDWMNENAGEVLKKVGFKNEEQFRKWIESEVDEVLNSMKEE